MLNVLETAPNLFLCNIRYQEALLVKETAFYKNKYLAMFRFGKKFGKTQA